MQDSVRQNLEMSSAYSPPLRLSQNARDVRFFEFDSSGSASGSPAQDPTTFISQGSYSSASQWLLDQCQRVNPTSGPSSPGSIRLAILDLPGAALWEYQTPEAQLHPILNALHIPLSACTTDDVVISHIFPPPLDKLHEDPGLQTITQSIASNTGGLAWHFYPRSAAYIGVVWIFDQEGQEEINYILQHLICLQSLLFHPSLVPLLALQAITISMRRWIHGQKNQVMNAQVASGFHNYAILESGRQADDANFGELSASVSGLAANIVTSEVCLSGLQLLGSSILAQNSSYNLSPAISAARPGIPPQAGQFIVQQTQYWLKEVAFMQTEAVAWHRKARIVVEGIFNLIAQRDQSMNIGIAKDSKTLAEQSMKIAQESKLLAERSQRIADKSHIMAEETKKDSTSMKAIAAVTMFFLPGTFVASFFAMPMFQWDDSGNSIQTHQFWLYWAVTIPLTLATMLAWRLWDWSAMRGRLRIGDQSEAEKTSIHR